MDDLLLPEKQNPVRFANISDSHTDSLRGLLQKMSVSIQHLSERQNGIYV